MGNISKKAGGPIRADEVGWEGLKKNPKADADAALLDLGLGGGVSKPIPYFTSETTSWTIYTVDKDEDDDKPGLYCLTIWDVPHDTMGLKLKYCYVRDDGTYGRVKWHPSYRLDDDERAAGRVEVPLGPLRARKKGASYKRIDIVRAVAVKRAAKDVGNPDLAEEDRRGKGTTPAYAPEAIPASGSYWGTYTVPFANRIRFTSGPNTMATILTGDYISGGPRINSVGTAKKEQDGVYFPVNVGSTANDDLLVSVRFGVYRVGTKAGGADTYSRRIPIPRYEFTEEDLAQMESTGNVTVDVGPLKANKRYHIRWVRGRYSLDPDDTDAKVIRTRWPAAAISGGADTTLNYLPSATSPIYSVNDAGTNISVPGNDGGSPGPTTTGPQLAILAPTGDIAGAPSNPDSSDIIVNEPDLATEKDKDARIILRFWASHSDHTKTFADMNVTRAAVVIRNITADGTTKQRRHAVDIEDPTAVSVNIEFHRQIGRPLEWVKNVSLNEADRFPSAGSALAFTAGASGDITDITLFTLSITNDADDNRQADAAVTFTNDATTPAVPKRIVILRSKSTANTGPPTTLAEINNGNANWKPVYKKNLRADSEVLALAGPQTLNYTIPGVVSSKGLRYYRAFMFVVGDATWVEDEDDNTGDADSTGITDTEVPSAPGTPTLRHRHGHMRSKTTRPTDADGNRTIFQYEWQFCSNIAFTAAGARTFLQDSDTTPITTSASTILTTGTKLSIPMKRIDFATWESGVTNIFCRVRAYNEFDPLTGGTWSATLTQAIGAAGVGLDDVEDIAVPATVAAPTARYRDGSLRLKCVRPASSTNTLDYYEWQISNDPSFSTGASIYYIQDNDTTPVTASSSTIQSENRKLIIPITRTDLALLAPVSGATARRPVLNFRVRAHNAIGDATYSPAGTLTLGRTDGDINRHGAIGRVNLVEGGGFMSARLQYAVGDPADQPGKWWKYRVITGMAGGAWRIENTRTGTASGTNSAGTADAGLSAVIWDAANHQLDFGYRGTGATLIYCAAATKLRRQLIAGEVYTLTFLLKSATAAFNPGTLVVGLTNDNSTTSASQSITFAGASDSTTPALGTSYRAYKATFTLASTPSGSAWLQFIFNNTAWTSGQHVYLDNICMVRGNQAMLFESAPADIVADESPLVTTFANGTESIGDVGGNGDDGIGTWGYMDV